MKVAKNPSVNNSVRSRVALVQPWFIPRKVESAIISRKYHAVSPAATVERIRILLSGFEGELGLPRRMNPPRRPTNTAGSVAAVAKAIVVARSVRRYSLAPFLPDSLFCS